MRFAVLQISISSVGKIPSIIMKSLNSRIISACKPTNMEKYKIASFVKSHLYSNCMYRFITLAVIYAAVAHPAGTVPLLR